MLKKLKGQVFCAGVLLLAFLGSNSKPVHASEAALQAASPNTSEAMAFARKMGVGWNLGNTLEATGADKTSVRDYETLWGNPVTTKAMIDAIKRAGFNSMRVPVAWSNLMGPDYTINTNLMARVKEVVQYGLDNDMYVIVNIHWDGGWITKFPTDPENSAKKYKAVWGQIAKEFKDYSNHLIFESLNEESNFATLWNFYTNKPNKKEEAYKQLNTINQMFTDLVRASGGKNGRRYLLIAGYTTDIARTVDPLFQMPKDPAAHSMVSVHYYSPVTFALLDKEEDWGKPTFVWGTPDEVKAVEGDFFPLKARFLDKGIPVVLGEFGPPLNKDTDSIVKYLTTIGQTTRTLGIVPILWDAGQYFNRRELKWSNPRIGEALSHIATNAHQ